MPAPGVCECVCECERAGVSGRGRGCHPDCSWGPAAPRVRRRLTGARGGSWLARAQPSPPILGACPNFLIQGTCRRSSCALPTVITVLSRQPPTVNAAAAAAAAVSADATIAAIATAFPLTGLAAREAFAASRGNTNLSTTLSCAPERGWYCEAGR